MTLDQAEMERRERLLEKAFHVFDDLVLRERADGGCVHESDGLVVCFDCRKRMFVLSLLPVLESALREQTERAEKAEVALAKCEKAVAALDVAARDRWDRWSDPWT